MKPSLQMLNMSLATSCMLYFLFLGSTCLNLRKTISMQNNYEKKLDRNKRLNFNTISTITVLAFQTSSQNFNITSCKIYVKDKITHLISLHYQQKHNKFFL